ncbi:MAG: exodeoxyribonuclease VII small subunit [Lentisphaerae bacterium GWF2_49_21]|nr:MAG: exodeoxyribonuclease VII small subunit [Lentisphaerae bacterium GWF2_49_21]
MKNDKKAKEPENLPFEKALERLETIIDKMESGNLQLDEMVKYFEEGTALSSLCEKKLKELEKKIEVLVKDGHEGKWKEFKSDDKKSNDEDSDIGSNRAKDSLL